MQNPIDYAEKIIALQSACQNFIDGWPHYLNCMDWGKSALDAEAIRFMNEVPGQIETALKALE